MTQEKINIAELLKDCPKGTELDCMLYDNCTFENVFEGCLYPIQIQTPEGLMTLTKYGSLFSNTHSKCVIFPKGKTTWEGFVPHCRFKNGDIITVVKESNPFIFHYDNGEFYDVHCGLVNDYLQIYRVKNNFVSNRREFRYATDEEKQKLFDAIKDNGYKWNAETKTLEKLIVQKFKVGDRIRKKGETSTYTITDVNNAHYFCGTYVICDTCDNDWTLVPDKFDINTLVPYESKVLVRDGENQYWSVSFWGCFFKCEFMYDTVRGRYKQCIPYEGNEHLLGKKYDCDEYYKTWE